MARIKYVSQKRVAESSVRITATSRPRRVSCSNQFLTRELGGKRPEVYIDDVKKRIEFVPVTGKGAEDVSSFGLSLGTIEKALDITFTKDVTILPKKITVKGETFFGVNIVDAEGCYTEGYDPNASSKVATKAKRKAKVNEPVEEDEDEEDEEVIEEEDDDEDDEEEDDDDFEDEED